ncbi:MAG TPA: hypothetical protein VF773_03090 [Verrucomicrobiae bacterium]
MKKEHGKVRALVAACDWIGKETPHLKEPGLKKILRSRFDQPEMVWVWVPAPRAFRTIGELKITKKQREANCGMYAYWESIPIAVLLKWRWDHEREAMMREMAAQDAERERAADRAAEKRQKWLSTVTFRKLLAKDLFSEWHYPQRKDTRDLEKILKEFIRNLAKEKPPLAKAFVQRELKQCVKKINTLDEERQFIETEERVDIFDIFEEILAAAKQPELLLLVDELRNW